MNTAQFIKTHREAAGLSQGDLADKLGYITPQFISNWERGVSFPPVSSIVKISKIINCDSVELFEIVKAEQVSRLVYKLTKQFRGVYK